MTLQTPDHEADEHRLLQGAAADRLVSAVLATHADRCARNDGEIGLAHGGEKDPRQ